MEVPKISESTLTTLWRSEPLRLLRQYAKFGVVGLMATAVHVSVFTLLIELLGLQPLSANLLAFAVAVFVSYLGNFHWTFKSDLEPRSNNTGKLPLTFARFTLVAVIGLVLNSLAVFLVVDMMTLPYGYAIIPMVGIVPAIVFALNKLWAFRPA